MSCDFSSRSVSTCFFKLSLFVVADWRSRLIASFGVCGLNYLLHRSHLYVDALYQSEVLYPDFTVQLYGPCWDRTV